MHTLIQQMKYKRIAFLVVLLLITAPVFGQYDTVHYFPPVFSRSSDVNDLGRNILFLSTNSDVPFPVTIEESDGTEIATVTISRTNSGQHLMGYQYDAIGIVDSTGLNIPLSTEGLVVRASQPFFANLRHSSGMQGMSMTAKGRSGLGTRFRAGFLYTRFSIAAGDEKKSHLVSVMATEDNTTVHFSGFREGVIFHGCPLNASGTATADFSVTLNKNQSYIIAAYLDEQGAFQNDLGPNGVLIESDLPVVVNSGSWCGGGNTSDVVPTRDIGMDQVLPVEMLGREYIMGKRNNVMVEEIERVIVIADIDGTELYINGSTQPAAVLDAGDYYVIPASAYDASNLMYLEASEAVAVYQSTNASEDLEYTQCMSIVPPLECSGMSSVTVPRIDSFDNTPGAIDVIARAGSPVSMNGTPLAQNPLTVPGNAGYVMYRLSGLTGTVSFESQNAITVAMLANTGARGAYAFYTGYADPFQVTVEAQAEDGSNMVAEACMEGMFVLTKDPALLYEDITYELAYSGSAENSADYTELPESLTIPAGQLTDTLFVEVLTDGKSEGVENIILMVVNSRCGTELFADTLFVRNYDPMELQSMADQAFCPENNDDVQLSAIVTGGVGPFEYTWSNDEETADIFVHPYETSFYQVSITDACGQKILSPEVTVVTLCLPEVPNVITANGDGVNDAFVIPHMEDFPGSSLTVQNRWGNVVYNSDDYDNSWIPTDLVDGTYFYTLELNTGLEVTSGETFDGHLITGFVEIVR